MYKHIKEIYLNTQEIIQHESLSSFSLNIRPVKRKLLFFSVKESRFLGNFQYSIQLNYKTLTSAPFLGNKICIQVLKQLINHLLSKNTEHILLLATLPFFFIIYIIVNEIFLPFFHSFLAFYGLNNEDKK